MRKALWAVVACCLLLQGCGPLIRRATTSFGNNLTGAMLNQDDPAIVRDGMPSYIILLDSLLEGNPDNPATLAAAATLYASYGAVFADDELRAMRLTRRSRDYAERAMCIEYAPACRWEQLDYDEFVATLGDLTRDQADALYTYSFAFLAWIRAHSSDWNALARLPHGEALLRRYLELAGTDARYSAHTYLGIMLTLRSASLGGNPEEAKVHFERAIQLSDGRDLGAKVEYAKGYARMQYDRDLHDRLIGEVLAASPYEDDLTLMNVLAQEEARLLQAEAEYYF